MPSVQGLLIDLSGVVYSGDAVIPGAGRAIERFKERGLRLRYLTNTTSQPRRAIWEKLRGFGLPIAEEEILTPIVAARRLIEEDGLTPHFLLNDAVRAEFAPARPGGAPAVILGDAQDGFTYAALNRAFRQVKAGARLIALANNRHFVDRDGALSLDMGAFVAALEYAAETEATVLGKPSPAFFALASRELGLEAGAVAMIGDDPEFDASAAVKAGLRGYLVATGKWRPDRDPPPTVAPPPTGVFNDLLSAADALLAPSARDA